MYGSFLKYFLRLCFAYVYLRLVIPYILFFLRYMFNERVGWDKYVEKPRLVFYGLGLALMHGSYNTFFEPVAIWPAFFNVLNWFVFIGGILLTQSTWTKRFKRVFIPKIKEKLKRKKNFNISVTDDQLKNLYNGLVRYAMIVIDQTKKDDFIKVFTEDWNTHNSKIHFKLDAPSCREFYELFKTHFPNNSITLIDFIERSDTIRKEDGTPYIYSTVKDAKSRTPISKRSNDLKDIFANL